MLSSYFNLELNNLVDYLWLSAGIILIISLIIQLRYLLFIYRKASKFKKKDVKSTTEPVSVIVCARNEAENLREFLPSILNQFYPEFEVFLTNVFVFECLIEFLNCEISYPIGTGFLNAEIDAPLV